MKTINVQKEMIEEVKAEYYDENYIRVPDYKFHRLQIGGVRHYLKVNPDESTSLSAGITSILSREMPTSLFLMQWYAMNGEEYCKWFLEMSGHYGTWFHIIAARMLRGEEVVLDNEWISADIQQYCDSKFVAHSELAKWMSQNNRDPRKDIYGFLEWSREYKPEPIALEFPISNETEGYSCTIDFVGYITYPEGGRFLVCIDWKTGKELYTNHELQLHAQRKAWDRQYPELKIEHIYNWSTHNYQLPIKKSVKPYKFVKQTDSENLWKLDHYLALFTGNAPKVKTYVDFKSTVVAIGKDLDVFEEIDPIRAILEHK